MNPARWHGDGSRNQALRWLSFHPSTPVASCLRTATGFLCSPALRCRSAHPVSSARNNSARSSLPMAGSIVFWRHQSWATLQDCSVQRPLWWRLTLSFTAPFQITGRENLISPIGGWRGPGKERGREREKAMEWADTGSGVSEEVPWSDHVASEVTRLRPPLGDEVRLGVSLLRENI